MTPSKCRGNASAGKCTPIYIVAGTSTSSEEHYITHWISGPSGFNPVINIDKASLK